MPLKIKANPPACELWEAFDYKPLTGELVRRSNNLTCGSSIQNGYAHVHFQGKRWKRSRFVWTWVTGKDSANQLDHINRHRSDDRFWNLREASLSLQNTNKRLWGKGYRWDGHAFEVYRQFNKQRLRRRFKTETEALAFMRQHDARMEQLRHLSDGSLSINEGVHVDQFERTVGHCNDIQALRDLCVTLHSTVQSQRRVYETLLRETHGLPPS